MQHTNAPGLRAPVPIFNYRKRPRQAVIADPQSAMPGPTGDASFSHSAQRNNTSSNNKSHNAKITNYYPVQSRYQPNNKTQDHGQQCCTGNYTAAKQDTHFSNSNRPVQQYPPSNCVPQRSGPQNDPKHKFIIRNNSVQQRPQSGVQQRPQSGVQQRPQAGVQQRPQAVPRADGSRYQTQTAPRLQSDDIDEWNNAFEDVPMPEDVHNPSLPMASKPLMKPATKTTKSVDLEQSTHFITCDISDVQHWATFKDKVTLLFETYGSLNSAISRAAGDCKEFIVRDEKNALLKCVFYEIDRQFPKVTRGQYYRLVGTYDADKELFTCLSLRAPSENERKMAAVLARKSSQVMAKLTRDAREP